MEMNKVRIGVIGCASKIAQEYHLPALRQIKGVIFKYACDMRLDEAKRIAADYGFEKVTDDYNVVLIDQEVDAVVILTRVDSHAEIAIAAADSGKQIFMQKALASSLQEAQNIIDVVRNKGIKMTVSFMHRYFDECMEAKKIIESQMLGRIQSVFIRNYTRNPLFTAPLYGGALMDIGSHGVDLIRALFSQEIERVKCLQLIDGDRPCGWDVDLRGDDTYGVSIYELTDKTRVIHEVAWSQVSQVDRFDVEIHATKGALYIRSEFADLPLLMGVAQDGAENKVVWTTPEYPKSFMGERHHRLFIDDLIYNTNHSLSAEDGFAALAVTEATCRSFKSGMWETPYQPK